MNNFISKVWSIADMERILARDTRHYAKRQYTWFNGITHMHWVDVRDQAFILNKIEQWLR
jgi:tRNA dimethylallyltransferase